MAPAARRQLASNDLDGPRGLRQKITRRQDLEAPRMTRPCLRDPYIDGMGLDGGLDAEWILLVVSIDERRRAKVDHRVVTRQLVLESRADRSPQIVGTGPVCETIDGAAVAQHERHVVHECGLLELALDVEDRALGRPPQLRRLAPRKAATEHDAGGLRQHLDVLAEGPAHQLEHRGLSCARPAGQYHPPRLVGLGAFVHPSSTVAPCSGTIASQPNASTSRRLIESAALGSPCVTNTRLGDSFDARSQSMISA